MFKIIALATALAVTPAIAGQTPSDTVTEPAPIEETCDDQVFPYALNYMFSEWVVTGIVTDYDFGQTQEETDAFVKAWNDARIAEIEGSVVPGLISADANQYITFVAPETFVPEDWGTWVFLYKDGCYVTEVFVPVKQLPDNPTPASLVLSPDGNSASFKPGHDFDLYRGT